MSTATLEKSRFVPVREDVREIRLATAEGTNIPPRLNPTNLVASLSEQPRTSRTSPQIDLDWLDPSVPSVSTQTETPLEGPIVRQPHRAGEPTFVHGKPVEGIRSHRRATLWEKAKAKLTRRPLRAR